MQHKRKPDRLMNREEIGNVIAEGIYHALRPLDEMVHQMERRWGADRLVGLVSVETAAKYGRAKAKLDRAIDDNWIVKSGLNAGDQIIVEGLQKVAPDAPVMIDNNTLQTAGNGA